MGIAAEGSRLKQGEGAWTSQLNVSRVIEAHSLGGAQGG
jgi:hypothetical protein